MAKAPIDTSHDLKHRISPAGVEWLAGELGATRMRFPRSRFIGLAELGLEELELKQRVDHVAEALRQVMPADFARAAEIVGRATDSPDFAGWMIFPVNEYIARAGLERPDVALPLLARTTSRWTAEFAIRPFIEHHFETTFRYLGEWVNSPDHHVRRLVSEGTRPRLPWGARLRDLAADPRPSLLLLDQLIDDESEYVRRSVANHLNDIAKDHPELALKTARRWLGVGRRRTPPPPHRVALVRHGLRTLIKRGDPTALALLGFDPEVAVTVSRFEVAPVSLTVGEYANIALDLAGPSEPAEVMIDYRIHYQGAKSVRAPKVFKWTNRTVSATAPLSLSRRHRFEHASVRRLHPGPHLIEVQINGQVLAADSLDLRL